jgi:ribonuclease HI
MAHDLAENALSIYTDGSQYSKPRRQGGIGFLFITVAPNGELVVHEESPPGWRGATNNQMELQACIEALKIATGRHPPVDLAPLDRIDIYSDSQYVCDNYKRAIFEWSRSGWKKRRGAPVANHLQWKEFVKLARRIDGMRKRLEIHWVEGHSKDEHNKQADRLAKNSARAQSEQMIRPARVRRRLSPNKCVAGSIQMRGQYETIRIITDEFLPPPHRCYSYMYEVVALKSPDFQLVDKATSEIQLLAGHSYDVRFNEDGANPRIEAVFEEVELKN